jgi:hypothetical protein
VGHATSPAERQQLAPLCSTYFVCSSSHRSRGRQPWCICALGLSPSSRHLIECWLKHTSTAKPRAARLCARPRVNLVPRRVRLHNALQFPDGLERFDSSAAAQAGRAGSKVRHISAEARTLFRCRTDISRQQRRFLHRSVQDCGSNKEIDFGIASAPRFPRRGHPPRRAGGSTSPGGNRDLN